MSNHLFLNLVVKENGKNMIFFFENIQPKPPQSLFCINMWPFPFFLFLSCGEKSAWPVKIDHVRGECMTNSSLKFFWTSFKGFCVQWGGAADSDPHRTPSHVTHFFCSAVTDAELRHVLGCVNKNKSIFFFFAVFTIRCLFIIFPAVNAALALAWVS